MLRSALCSFLPYLRRALTNLIRKYEPTYLYLSPASSSSQVAGTASTPGLLTREFSLAFLNLSITDGIRDLRTAKIGQLMAISGTVTRTSEVRPELVFGAFVCQECRTTVGDVEQQFKYTEVRRPSCPSRRASNFSDCRLTLVPLSRAPRSAAHHVPEPDVLEPDRLDAQRRAVQVL